MKKIIHLVLPDFIARIGCKHIDVRFKLPLTVSDRSKGRKVEAYCGNCGKDLGLK